MLEFRLNGLALSAWPEMRLQFIPKYVCWLNLIEPWWKQFRSLALKGQCFEPTDELLQTFNNALIYWNNHCHPYEWKKKPQPQIKLLRGYEVATPTIYS